MTIRPCLTSYIYIGYSHINHMKIEYKESVGKNPNFLKSTVEISQKCNHYLIFSSNRIFSISSEKNLSQDY